jgi:hypothetical protein
MLYALPTIAYRFLAYFNILVSAKLKQQSKLFLQTLIALGISPYSSGTFQRLFGLSTLRHLMTEAELWQLVSDSKPQ